MKRQTNSKKLFTLSWPREYKTTSKSRTALMKKKKLKRSLRLKSSWPSSTNNLLISRLIIRSLLRLRLHSSSKNPRKIKKMKCWNYLLSSTQTLLTWILLVLSHSNPWSNPRSKKLTTKSMRSTSISSRSTWAKSSRWWQSLSWRPKLFSTPSMT